MEDATTVTPAAPTPAPAKKPAAKRKAAAKPAPRSRGRRHDAAQTYVRNFLASQGVAQAAFTEQHAAELISAIDAA